METLTCPKCGETIDDLWEYDGNEDGSCDIECPSCDAPLVLTCMVSITREVEAGTLATRVERLRGELDRLKKELGMEDPA